MAGHARVIDGDTLAIGSVVFRLQGIAAPHLRQLCTMPDGNLWHCGTAARKHLTALIAGRVVTCFPNGEHPQGRIIAACHVWRKVNLNSRMVWDGYAVSTAPGQRATAGNYVGEQRYARLHHLGIWATSFVMPWKWHRNAI